tara:strand:- start:824 stop:2059 length:1236 start_codon:yes stop_codon:yes gene_type:complete
MIELEYNSKVPDGNVIVWDSQSNWLYITVLGVKTDNSSFVKPYLNNLIGDMLVDSFEESVQISLLIKNSIKGYDIVTSDLSSLIFVHTNQNQLNNFSSNKKIIDKSVTTEPSKEIFPKYNTNFKSAFQKARLELGPNSIFRFKGSLYHTNHPDENSNMMVSSKNKYGQELDTFFDLHVNDNENLEAEIYTEVKESDISPVRKTKRNIRNFLPKIFRKNNKIGGTISEDKNLFLAELTENSITKEAIKSSIEDKSELTWWEKLPFVVSSGKATINRTKNKNNRFLSVGQSAIKIDANIEGVPIYIDGRYIGHTPLVNPVRVEPGWHQVSGFSPQYLMYLNTGAVNYVSNDPMLNNQIFGTETIYVEDGKIARSEMRFDYVGPSIPVKSKNGGWLFGFPVVILFFQLLTWGTT